jgi:hypothetical protein
MDSDAHNGDDDFNQPDFERPITNLAGRCDPPDGGP